MRLFLIDRITHIVPWESARAVKLVSASEDFIQHGSQSLYMPRGLVLECAFQAAAWLIVISSDRTLRPVVLCVDGVRWFGNVGPGDRIEMQVKILQHDDQMAEVAGEASVLGSKILEVSSGLCSLMHTSELDTAGGASWMISQISRPQLVPEQVRHRDLAPGERTSQLARTEPGGVCVEPS